MKLCLCMCVGMGGGDGYIDECPLALLLHFPTPFFWSRNSPLWCNLKYFRKHKTNWGEQKWIKVQQSIHFLAKYKMWGGACQGENTGNSLTAYMPLRTVLIETKEEKELHLETSRISFLGSLLK